VAVNGMALFILALAFRFLGEKLFLRLVCYCCPGIE